MGSPNSQVLNGFTIFIRRIYLEFVLLAAEVGALLLPEVVRLDDEGGVDAAPKLVLQHLHTNTFE